MAKFLIERLSPKSPNKNCSKKRWSEKKSKPSFQTPNGKISLQEKTVKGWKL